MARSAAKRVAGTLLFLLALVAVLVFYFILFADSRQVNDVPGVGNLPGVAVAVGVLLGIVAIVLIALVASRGRAREAPAEAESTYFVPPEPQPIQPYGAPAFEEVDDDLVVYDVWRLPSAQRSWAAEDQGQPAYYFPLNVDGGVYVNDYIPIGRTEKGQRLKLRTLLAGPPDVEAAAFTIPASRARPERPAPTWEPERGGPAQRPSDRPERPADRPARPSRDVPGDSFMRELERRFTDGKGPQVAVQAPEPAYYDYAGDVHDVLDVEGIGPLYAERLRQMGVHTTSRLCYEDAGRIAEAVGVPRRTAESWQAMAQLMKVHGIGKQYAEALARAGIDLEALRRRSPARVAEEVNAHLDTIGVTVTGGRVTERRVETWQQAARQMRRARMRIPEK